MPTSEQSSSIWIKIYFRKLLIFYWSRGIRIDTLSFSLSLLILMNMSFTSTLLIYVSISSRWTILRFDRILIDKYDSKYKNRSRKIHERVINIGCCRDIWKFNLFSSNYITAVGNTLTSFRETLNYCLWTHFYFQNSILEILIMCTLKTIEFQNFNYGKLVLVKLCFTSTFELLISLGFVIVIGFIWFGLINKRKLPYLILVSFF